MFLNQDNEIISSAGNTRGSRRRKRRFYKYANGLWEVANVSGIADNVRLFGQFYD
jgi:hypothetical protein